jgi:F-type H+-transporting ATPase subunit alpha
MERMKDAEAALQNAAKEIPAEVAERLVSDKPLSDADKKVLLDIATRTLAAFLPKPETPTTTEAKK